MQQLSLDLSVFSIPIWRQVIHNIPLQIPIIKRRVYRRKPEKGGNTEVFSEVQCWKIRERLLQVSLGLLEQSILLDPILMNEDPEIIDAWEWFWSDDFSNPFSFNNCLLISGYAVDASEFRAEFVNRINYNARRQSKEFSTAFDDHDMLIDDF